MEAHFLFLGNHPKIEPGRNRGEICNGSSTSLRDTRALRQTRPFAGCVTLDMSLSLSEAHMQNRGNTLHLAYGTKGPQTLS